MGLTNINFEDKKWLISTFVTSILVLALALSGPAGAVLVEIEELTGTHTIGESIEFFINATIGGNERIPISNITIEGLPDMSGSLGGILVFNVSDFSNVSDTITKGNYEIELVTRDGWIGGTGGDGYGYNNDSSPYFGYGTKYHFDGYGYGYNNSSTAYFTNIRYKITMTTTGASADVYDSIKVSIYTGDTVHEAFVSDTASITLTVTPTPTPTPTATPAPSGGGGVGPSSVNNVPTDNYGKVTSTTTVSSSDGSSKITLNEGTTALDSKGKALKSVTINPASTLGGTIGLINLGPDGATFEPAITLSFTFDPNDVPEGKAVVIKVFDGTGWIELETTVDTVTNTATAKVSHFTMFGLFTEKVPVKKSYLSQAVGQPSFNYDEVPPAYEPAIITPTQETTNIGPILTIVITMVVVALGVYYFRRSEL